MSYYRKLFIIGVVLLSTTVNSFALKAEYRFEECNGSPTTKNHQSSNLNGKLSGDANITKDGKIENALTLSGSGMMSVEHDSNLDIIENLTVTFWVKPKDKRRQALISRGGGSGKGGSNAEYSLVLWENGKFKYKHNNGADTFSNSIIPLDKWTHIALVRDNGLKNIKIYINGKLDTNKSYTIDPSSSNTEKLIIGSGELYSSTMKNFKGSLDEIKIYNIALSKDDINSIYNSENSGTHHTGECKNIDHLAPEAIDDTADIPVSRTIIIDVLDNDIVHDSSRCELNSSTVKIVSNFSGSTLSDDNRTLKVPNQGVWSVLSSGSIEFVSDRYFYDNPTDISYVVSDSCGALSNRATISLTRVALPLPTPTPTPVVTSTPTPIPTTTNNLNPVEDDDDNNQDITPTPIISNSDNDTTNSSKGINIGDRVWFDTDKNGIQDSKEEGVDGVIVVLYDSKGEVVDRVTTNASGEYQFKNLNRGTYSIGFTNLPKDYIFTAQNMGDDDTKDSDVDSSGRISNITIKESNFTYDAGVIYNGTKTSDNNQSIGANANCDCDDYKSSIPSISRVGVLAILILVGFLGLFFIKEEELDFNK